MATILEEFYFMALPYRFRLHEQDSTPSIDVMHQNLFGAHAGHVKALCEIATFSDITSVQDSNVLLAVLDNIETGLKKYDQDTNKYDSRWVLPNQEESHHLLEMMIDEWGLLQCFCSFLEMCRCLIPEIQDLSIGATDDCVVSGDKIDVTGVRHIPYNVIYRHQGWYYLNLKEGGVVSNCYKTLLGHAYRSFKRELEDEPTIGSGY